MCQWRQISASHPGSAVPGAPLRPSLLQLLAPGLSQAEASGLHTAALLRGALITFQPTGGFRHWLTIEGFRSKTLLHPCRKHRSSRARGSTKDMHCSRYPKRHRGAGCLESAPSCCHVSPHPACDLRFLQFDSGTEIQPQGFVRR